VLLSFFAYESTFSGGIYVATGKLDASGHADIITGPGAGRKPEIKAFNGGTQALMLDFAAFSDISGGGLFTGDSSFNTGVRVAAADKNGDGIDDIVAGPGPIQKSYVEIYNGTNGQVMSSALAFDPAFLGGIYVG